MATRFRGALIVLVAVYWVTSFPSARPNVVLILSDGHSTPRLGVYEKTGAVTANIDQFVVDGVTFDRA